jgi:hypothetical protein
MARKLNIPKAAQIRGLRKAIANRKTPRQFIPSLKKRLAKLTAVFILASCLLPLASVVHAQAPVSIIPTQQILAPSGTLCNAGPLIFPVQNRNQTQHYAYIKTVNVTNLVMQIQGVDANGNTYVISDTSMSAQSVTGSNSSLEGSGYFPTVQVSVSCLPATGTFSLNYSGSQATTNVNVGSYLISQQDKAVASLSNAGATYATPFFSSPYGSSYGTLYFTYSATGPAGSQINVFCENQNGTGPLYTFNLATGTSLQTFTVPPGPCSNIEIQYSTGGASSTTYILDMIFLTPGATATNSYTHITGTTATVVKAGPGVVHTVVVGTPAAGTISLFDLVSGSCTGTPATNVVSVITATSTFPAAPEIYDVLFNNGICVKASATMDITVSSQ